MRTQDKANMQLEVSVQGQKITVIIDEGVVPANTPEAEVLAWATEQARKSIELKAVGLPENGVMAWRTSWPTRQTAWIRRSLLDGRLEISAAKRPEDWE